MDERNDSPSPALRERVREGVARGRVRVVAHRYPPSPALRERELPGIA
jgi:hypothetical protein